MELLDFAPLLGIPAVVKVLDVYRQAWDERNAKKSAMTVGAWVVGTGMVYLVSASSADAIPAGIALADAVLLGIGAGSTGSLAHDFLTRNKATEGHENVMPTVVVHTDGSVTQADEIEPE